MGGVARLQDRREAHAATATARFLERVFHKLLLNFTWWVNRKDAEGHNVFQGGFLGLDNIGVFDRSRRCPTGGHLEQTDGTSWMGMYCLNMLAIALELARDNRAYEDIATKFFEHFVYIADAMNNLGGKGVELWDERGRLLLRRAAPARRRARRRCKVRSMVGLIPLFAVETLESERRRPPARLQAPHAVVPREPPRAARRTSRR